MYDVWLFGIKCHLVVRTWSKDALSKGHHTGIMMASQMKHCPRYLFIGIEFTYVILVCVGLMWCFPMFDQHRGFANHSLTHSPSHSPSHSLTKSPTHQLTNSFHNSTTHCLTYSLTHKRFPSLQVLDKIWINQTRSWMNAKSESGFLINLQLNVSMFIKIIRRVSNERTCILC